MVKEAQPSALVPFVGDARQKNQGQRVVEGQRLMQASSDIFPGWLRVKGLDGEQRDFYVRQPCGWTLAWAHARSGDRSAIASYLGSGDAFDRIISARTDI